MDCYALCDRFSTIELSNTKEPQVKNQFKIFIAIIFLSTHSFAQNASEETKMESSTVASSKKTTKKPEQKNFDAKEQINEVPGVAKEKDSDTVKFLENLDYPELQVVPRATARLQNEAAYESERSHSLQWTFYTSGLATLYMGYKHNGNYKQENPTDEQKASNASNALMAEAIGLGTLGVAAFMAISKPYTKANDDVKRVKGNDRKSELYRERIAEEGLEKPALLMDKLTTIAIGANLLAFALVVSEATDETKNTAYIAGVASMLPYLFESPYITNYQKQLEYKRKIYVPLSSFQFFPNGNKLIPGVALNWNF